jgi:hypothetical protein
MFRDEGKPELIDTVGEHLSRDVKSRMSKIFSAFNLREQISDDYLRLEFKKQEEERKNKEAKEK